MMKKKNRSRAENLLTEDKWITKPRLVVIALGN